MSKVLRRPLFRGGPVDPRGTGITSGLDDGRVRKQTGGDFFQKYILGPKFGGVMTPQQELMQNLYTLPPGASDVDRMKAMAELISEQQIGEPLQGDGIVPSYLTATPFYKTAYGDAPEEVEGQLARVPLGDSYEPKKQNNIDDIDDIEGVADEGRAAMQFDKDSGFGYGSLDAFEDMSIGAKVNAEIRAKDREKGNTIVPDETEISQEDIIDSIFKERVAKAKRGDIADVLGGAAEGFLTGGLREGLVGATRASRGPGRAEQLENTLASLKVQDKLGQAKEKRTQKFELEKLEKAIEGQVKVQGVKSSFDRITDRGEALKVLRNPDKYSKEDIYAAKIFLKIPPSLSYYLAQKDQPIGTDITIGASTVYGDQYKGTIDSNTLKQGANVAPGIYVDTKTRQVIQITEDGDTKVLENF